MTGRGLRSVSGWPIVTQQQTGAEQTQTRVGLLCVIVLIVLLHNVCQYYATFCVTLWHEYDFYKSYTLINTSLNSRFPKKSEGRDCLASMVSNRRYFITRRTTSCRNKCSEQVPLMLEMAAGTAGAGVIRPQLPILLWISHILLMSGHPSWSAEKHQDEWQRRRGEIPGTIDYTPNSDAFWWMQVYHLLS